MQKKGTNVWNSRAMAFLKRNVYYVLMIVCVLAIGAVVTTVAVLNSKDTIIDVGGDVKPPIVNPDVPNPTPDPPEPPPVIERKFVITMPVFNGIVGKAFVDSTLVMDNTLGKYKTHLGVDLQGELGTNVIAGFEGTVESITSDSYYGTVITISHQDGFKSVYKLVDESTMKVGDQVTDTTVIGVVGRFYSGSADATHVHYELTKDGEAVDPMLYILAGDK